MKNTSLLACFSSLFLFFGSNCVDLPLRAESISNNLLDIASDLNFINQSKQNGLLLVENFQESKSLIANVPFVSFAEIRGVNYANKAILNPSLAAAYAVILKFWGQDLSAMQQGNYWGEWADLENFENGSMKDLKSWIDQGIPVLVSPMALTPNAHPLYNDVKLFAALGIIPESLIIPKGPISGMLGSFVSLDVFPKIQEHGIEFNYVRESVTGSARVMVGYDDLRQVVFLHDASFGPAWEVSYEDFETMWSAGDRSYQVIFPLDEFTVSAPVSLDIEAIYYSRTPEQKATEFYVKGYGLAAVGYQSEAIEFFEQGRMIPGISVGLKHLLQLELAGQLLCCGDMTAYGMSVMEDAISLLPENSAPFYMLSQHHKFSGNSSQSAQMLRQADKLCNNADAALVLRNTFPKDLPLKTCQGTYF